MAKINWLKLITSLVICQAAGALGSLLTFSGVSTWYTTLNKPWFNPPNWVFGPVWTILFILMGIALYLIWINQDNKIALMIFTLQLLLNIGWSFCFFYLQNPLAGLLEITVLWLAIIMTIYFSYRVKRLAAYLLLPYIIWVSWAAILNFYLYILN